MATSIEIIVDESTLRSLVLNHVTKLTGVDLEDRDIVIQVKSKQNYKSEWEVAAFRAAVKVTRE